MRKVSIGLICDSRALGKEQKLFQKVAQQVEVNLVLFNLADVLDEKEIEEKIKKCDIIYKDTGGPFAMEIVKTIEGFGKKVVEKAQTFYYNEDKWLFYLNCRKNRIQTPETILLPDTITGAKIELERFDRWPAVLKRIDYCGGLFVEKADNLSHALRIIKKFWVKSGERVPIIAQEFVKSYSYRVFAIEGKIVQTAIKKGNGWKLTGVYAARFWKFKPDKEIKEITRRVYEFTKIKILGIDLLKKNKKWYVLEANAEPSFNFFDSEKEKLIGKVLSYLKKEA